MRDRHRCPCCRRCRPAAPPPAEVRPSLAGEDVAVGDVIGVGQLVGVDVGGGFVLVVPAGELVGAVLLVEAVVLDRAGADLGHGSVGLHTAGGHVGCGGHPD